MAIFLHVVTLDQITPGRVLLGKVLTKGSAAILALSFLALGLSEYRVY